MKGLGRAAEDLKVFERLPVMEEYGLFRGLKGGVGPAGGFNGRQMWRPSVFGLTDC